ncbi:nuclear transport factor 2 family protein [Nocardioides humi]|uniref:SnoaL-like domain-containing protein n=1 Tax=Nocardioides humi TaxID=449461 RepID=A0ABN2AG88_9ACTN|nr:nuclear transport factor 2 family protein [Nocardioides humi]
MSAPTERSPREVADRLAIYELYARYAQAADLEDGAAYASCFTEDGWTDISSFGHTAASFRERGLNCLDETGKVRGRANLTAVATKRPGQPLYRHLTMNAHVSSYEGDRALGSAYFVVLSPDGAIHQFGRYEDVIVRDVDGAWRFAERMDLAAYNSGSTL